ncbi:MAG: hypothetical protein JNM84_17720 [Planctomycetes bacterium]|nr:hypothetical protein [Planctomycetota bacterium]
MSLLSSLLRFVGPPRPQLGRSRACFALGTLLALSLPACSGGGGGGNGRFSLESTGGLLDNVTWQINRPIEITFNQAVDLSSANLNSIQIYEVLTGVPAVGSFFLKAGSGGRTLVFQPLCPTNNSFDNGGLLPFGTQYRLAIPTANGRNATVLKSTEGERISLGITRQFTTPTSSLEFFLDPRPQAPPLVTKIFVGSEQVFPDPATGGIPANPVDIGLNSYSDPIDPIVVQFDQPLRPTDTNISTSNFQLLYDVPGGATVQVPIVVTLVENCGIEGSTVMLSPQGLLPQGSNLRLRIKRELQDIVGETNLADIDPLRFAVQPLTETLTDAFFEDFRTETYWDSQAVFPEPRAEWATANRTLAPATPFDGTNIDFDWVIQGTTVIDTDFDTITNATGTLTQPVANGIVDVRNFTINAGSTLRAQGSNPLVILCTGNVTINGTLLMNGINNPNVNTVCSTAIPERGSPGTCSGGSGGTGSFETTTSTRRGGPGNGAFNALGAGGQGGDSGVGTAVTQHRAGGGGGGTWRQGTCITTNPPAARSDEGRCGRNGPSASQNCSFQQPCPGGASGPALFRDTANNNNFFGVRSDLVLGVIFGELNTIQGGQGGGAGGDSIQWASCPSPNWNSANASAQNCDLKGAGGGGGGGAVVIKALGTIRVAGQILAVGGSGGSGESTGGTNTVPGGSGAGAGGMIILMSTSSVNLTGATLDARGGTGGPGGGRVAYPADSAGGHGGSGVIQVHVPDPLANLTPPNPPGTPAPVVLVPDFGSVSVAQSKWISTGFSDPGSGTIFNPPFYWFDGTQPTGANAGLVDRSANNTVQNPPRYFETYRVDQAEVTANSIRLPSVPIEIDNPAIMIGWELADESDPNRRSFTIVGAAYEGGETLLTTDAADGNLLTQLTFVQATAVVSLNPRYFRILTDGVEGAYPPSVGVFIQFQGADPLSNNPSQPDPSTVVPSANTWTGDVSVLNGKQFFRTRFLFNLNFNLQGLSSTSPRAEIDFFKLPFRF